jgi:hypothetical protein
MRNSQSTPQLQQSQQFQKPHYVNQAFINSKTKTDSINININNPNRPHFSFKNYNNNNNYPIKKDVSQLIIQPRAQSAK